MRQRICNALFIIAIVFSGCASAEPGVDRAILDHQRQVSELEARNRELEARLDAYNSVIETNIGRLESVSNIADSMGTEIDVIISLFDEYQRGVNQLIQDYNALRNAIASDTTNTISSSDNNSNPNDL